MPHVDRRTISAPHAIKAAHIAIIGAGLSGSLAAVVLARTGYQVTLIDKHAAFPKQFRVEKIAGRHIDLMRKLGVFDAIASDSNPFSRFPQRSRGPDHRRCSRHPNDPFMQRVFLAKHDQRLSPNGLNTAVYDSTAPHVSTCGWNNPTGHIRSSQIIARQAAIAGDAGSIKIALALI